MSFNILELLNSMLGGPLIRQASGYFGETEKSTHSAVRLIEPTLLAGLMQWAATPTGAAEVFSSVTDDSIDPGIGAKLPGIFTSRGSLESLLDNGESLADLVFGSRLGGVTSAISKISGAMPDSALALISLMTPVLFGMLRKYVVKHGLNAAELGALLLQQRGAIADSHLPDRVVSALGYGSKTEMLEDLSAAAAQAVAPLQQVPATNRNGRRNRRAWLPWAVAAGVALPGLLLLVNRTADRHDVETASVPAVSDGMRHGVQQAAASTRVYFEAGKARIDREDRQKIASAAASAKQHGRPVTITGYTDRSGNADGSYELAKDRVAAVRDALVDAGVAAEKIVMDPVVMDSPAPLAGSQQDEQTRRVDIAIDKQ